MIKILSIDTVLNPLKWFFTRETATSIRKLPKKWSCHIKKNILLYYIWFFSIFEALKSGFFSLSSVNFEVNTWKFCDHIEINMINPRSFGFHTFVDKKSYLFTYSSAGLREVSFAECNLDECCNEMGITTWNGMSIIVKCVRMNISRNLNCS